MSPSLCGVVLTVLLFVSPASPAWAVMWFNGQAAPGTIGTTATNTSGGSGTGTGTGGCTGVTPGSYSNANITVNSNGCVTAASSGTAGPVPFSTVTAGTVLGQAFVVGNGSTLGPGGSGVLTANALTGALMIGSGSSLAPTGSGAVTANLLTGNILLPSGSSLSAAAGASITATNLASIADPTVILTTTNVKKVFGKQNVARVVPYTPSGSPLTVQINCDNTDIATIDALAGDLTMAAPLCTGSNPEPEQELEVRLRSATQRVITWNDAFCEDNNIPLFAATTGDGVKFDRIKFRRNSLSACWSVISTTRGTNKGVTTLTSSTTFTCQVDIAEACEMQATMAAGGPGTPITIAIPTSPTVPLTNGQKVLFRLLCTNAQTVVMTTGAGGFVASPNVPLLTACPAGTSAWTAAGAIFSSVLNRWQIYATN